MSESVCGVYKRPLECEDVYPPTYLVVAVRLEHVEESSDLLEVRHTHAYTSVHRISRCSRNAHTTASPDLLSQRRRRSSCPRRTITTAFRVSAREYIERDVPSPHSMRSSLRKGPFLPMLVFVLREVCKSRFGGHFRLQHIVLYMAPAATTCV